MDRPLFAVAVAIGLMAIALCLVAWWGARVPAKHRLRAQDAAWVLGTLLRRGYKDGYVVFEVPQTPNFVQARKYIDARGYGLEFHVPRATWNRPGYAALLDGLPSLKWKVRRQAVEHPPEGGVAEFAIIDCGQDVALSTQVLAALLQFDGVPSDTMLVARVHGASPRDEVIST